jgi:hypothetical protein
MLNMSVVTSQSSDQTQTMSTKQMLDSFSKAGSMASNKRDVTHWTAVITDCPPSTAVMPTVAIMRDGGRAMYFLRPQAYADSI